MLRRRFCWMRLSECNACTAHLPLDRYVEEGIATPDQADQLRLLVECGITTMISGSQVLDKTTLVRSLIGLIPEHERIVTMDGHPRALPDRRG